VFALKLDESKARMENAALSNEASTVKAEKTFIVTSTQQQLSNASAALAESRKALTTCQQEKASLEGEKRALENLLLQCVAVRVPSCLHPHPHALSCVGVRACVCVCVRVCECARLCANVAIVVVFVLIAAVVTPIVVVHLTRVALSCVSVLSQVRGAADDAAQRGIAGS
jgi:hypothetical protein